MSLNIYFVRQLNKDLLYEGESPFEAMRLFATFMSWK